ncbi:acyltransferase family protein [Aliirhizobium smilacinae]|nr:acyltransferase [Rhizobium smilacinae]
MISLADKDSSKSNNFGSIRLALASLVILSHSPVLIDGNSSREILINIFGTISFGELAVDGFFIVSGFLIAKSFCDSSLSEYFVKRIVRIYPGFLVCFALCAFILAPVVVGATALMPATVIAGFAEAVRLRPPLAAGGFANIAYPDMNGSLWTIAYEFRCYVIAAVCGLLGLYRSRGKWIFLAITAILLALNTSGLAAGINLPIPTIIGEFGKATRLTGLFFSGTCFFLFRDHVPFPKWGGILSFAFLIAGLSLPPLAELAVATFGAYLIFWIAYAIPVGQLEAFTRKQDLSYGIYLYAWPIQNSFIYWFGIQNHLLLSAITLVIAAAMASLSWRFVEKPAQDAMRSFRSSGPRKTLRDVA